MFRIDFDSSLFDGLLIRTLFHRCAQCFVDMILFDPTSPSVKVVSARRSCIGRPCAWKKFKFGITTTFSNWTISLFWGRAPRKSSIFVLRWFIKLMLYLQTFCRKRKYYNSLGRLVWRWREIRAGDASRERECLQKAELMKHSSGSGCWQRCATGFSDFNVVDMMMLPIAITWKSMFVRKQS